MDAPDGYLNVTDYGYGSGTYISCSVWIKRTRPHPQRKVFQTRGKTRNCGSGPFFKAQMKPDAITITTGVIAHQLFHSANQQGYFVTELSVDGVAHGIQVRKSDLLVVEVIRRQREVRDDSGTQVQSFTRIGSYRPVEKYLTLSDSWDQTCEEWVAYASGLSDALFGWRAWASERIYGYYRNVGRLYRPIEYRFPDFNFKYGELDAFYWITDFGIYPKGWPGRFQACYLDAISNFEVADVNSLANILEGASAIVKCIADIRGIFHGDWEMDESTAVALKRAIRRKQAVIPRSHFSSRTSSAWLSYRYEFMTTIMDLKSYKMMLKRLGDLASITGNLHSTGYQRFDDQSYKVELIVDATHIVPANTVEFLAAVGVEPNLQNLWDLVPYSFVVDWFVNISRLAGIADQFGKAIDLPIKQAWFTYMSHYDGQHVFMRLPGKKLNVLPAYAEHQASTGTIVNRILDSLSLFSK